MATAFETGIEAAGTAVGGYLETALPVVAAIGVWLLAVKYALRLIRQMAS